MGSIKYILYMVWLFSFEVYCQEIVLTVNKTIDTVSVGDTPSYNCFINKDAEYLLENPIKWEQYGRDGSKKVISVLGNLQPEFQDDFNVQLTHSKNGMSFTLTFKNGIKEVYDGFLKCVLYNKHNEMLDVKQVEIHVIRMKFTLGSTSQTEVGVPALTIGLEEGDYEIVCKSFGSNPNASVHIYLNNEELMDPKLVIEDMNKTEPARAWNAQKNISLTLNLNNDDQILKCVSVDNNDPSVVAELSFKLDIFDGFDLKKQALMYGLIGCFIVSLMCILVAIIIVRCRATLNPQNAANINPTATLNDRSEEIDNIIQPNTSRNESTVRNYVNGNKGQLHGQESVSVTNLSVSTESIKSSSNNDISPHSETSSTRSEEANGDCDDDHSLDHTGSTSDHLYGIIYL